MSHFRRCLEQVLERLARLPDDAKRVLQRPAEKVQLLDDGLHRERVREEEQVPRAFDVPVPHHVELPDRRDLLRVSEPASEEGRDTYETQAGVFRWW